MSNFGTKGSITDKDLPEEYDVILEGFENYLAFSSPDALPIKLMCDKLNHWYEKLKIKVRKRNQKKKH